MTYALGWELHLNDIWFDFYHIYSTIYYHIFYFLTEYLTILVTFISLFYFIFLLSAVCSENELEEVLTTYTKLNKSASIFLGSNSKSYGDKVSPQSAAAQEGSLPRRKETLGGSAAAGDQAGQVRPAEETIS